MGTIELAERIAALPSLKRAQVERFVDQIAKLKIGMGGDESLVKRARSIRERTFEKYGALGDSADEIRRLREEGR